MSDTLLRRFLRYEIHSYLIFFYCIALLLPFINFSMVLSSAESNPITTLLQLILTVIGLFASSGAIGYILYQIYDTFWYPKQIDAMLNGILKNCFLQDDEWMKARDKLREIYGKDKRLAEQLINYSLYAKDKRVPLDSRAIDTIRGHWAHIQARSVGSFAFIPACFLFVVTLLFLNQVEGLIILNARMPWMYARVLSFIFLLAFIAIVSYILISRVKHILKDLCHFVCLVLRHNLKSLNRMLDTLHLEENL